MSGAIIFKLLDGVTQVAVLRDGNPNDSGFDATPGKIGQAIVVDSSGHRQLVYKDRLSNAPGVQDPTPVIADTDTSGVGPIWNP